MTNDKDCAALLREAMGRLSKFCDEWAKMRHTDDDIQGLHFGEERQAVLRASDIRTVVAALKSHGQAFDAAILDRAELAWQRFFYPAADNFTAPLGNKLPSVDLEVADCLRLVLAAMGRHVVTPQFGVPSIQTVARDARLKTVAEKLAAFTGAPNEDWRHFTVEAGDILDRLDNLATSSAPQPAFDAAGVREACAKVADDVLTCDVKLPPATTVRAGCSFDTLRLAMSAPGRPRHFDEAEPDTIATAIRDQKDHDHGI